MPRVTWCGCQQTIALSADTTLTVATTPAAIFALLVPLLCPRASAMPLSMTLRRSARFVTVEANGALPLERVAAEAESSGSAAGSKGRVRRSAPPSEPPVTGAEKKKQRGGVGKAAKAAKAALSHAPRTREESAWAAGFPLVVGCDEAGRGPLAGPVVAAACVLPADVPPIPGIGDSKTITDESTREVRVWHKQPCATPCAPLQRAPHDVHGHWVVASGVRPRSGCAHSCMCVADRSHRDQGASPARACACVRVCLSFLVRMRAKSG